MIIFVSNERQSSYIGLAEEGGSESSYKLSRDFVAGHSEMDWEAMEGLRHVLVHDYYTVNIPAGICYFQIKVLPLHL